ncbi:MAG: toll/interleukin-1 receptor domain-containing protein [Synergistaceae bacterium]|nr:toll/interleukin-1 receptor domain-containing protein [Synergistaceae bacterium]
MKKESFKYYAFISYSHKDMNIAKKLQKRLEKYHLPSDLLVSHPTLPKNLSPVFIDEFDLIPGGTLKEAIQKNLDRSNYLILIASPNSANSVYVNDEVEYFIKTGRADHIIPFIVDGVPHSKDPSRECFPPALLGMSRENELLGIDLQVHGARNTFSKCVASMLNHIPGMDIGEYDLRNAFIRLIATLLHLDVDDFIARDAKERKRKKIMLASMAAALLIAARLLMPPPYDETLAENVMAFATSAYVRAGTEYERLYDLTECAINNPAEFSRALELYKRQISLSGMSGKNSIQYLHDMMKTGKVMPWSGQPMYQEECEELLTLAASREDEYKRFASVLEFVMTDEYGKLYYSAQYPELLSELLEIDAKIAAELYQIVCAPHLTGKYADNSPEAQALMGLFSYVPKQNKHLTGENVKQSRESLTSLKGARFTTLGKLNSCGAFEAYDIKYGKKE